MLRLLSTATSAAAAVELAGGAVGSGTVRAVLERRLARLPQETHDVLSWAALDGAGLDVDVLAGVTGRSRDDVLRALDPAVAAGMVELDDDGRPAFAHDPAARDARGDAAAERALRRHWCLGVAQPVPPAGAITRTSRTAGHLVAGAAAAGDAEEAASGGGVADADEGHEGRAPLRCGVPPCSP